MTEEPEDYVGRINDDERQMIEFVILYFHTIIPAGTPKTNREVAAYLEKSGFKKPDRSRVNKIISFIQIHGLVDNLLVSDKGYFTSSDPIDFARYIHILEEKGKTIFTVVKLLKKKKEELTNPKLF